MNRTLPTTLLAILLAASAWSGGCVKREVVLVPPGEPVQLAEPVEAYIYVCDGGECIRSPSKVLIPTGYWCLPDPGP